MKAKKLIEEKQRRLNRFVDQGRLTQDKANDQVRVYAQVVCGVSLSQPAQPLIRLGRF